MNVRIYNFYLLLIIYVTCVYLNFTILAAVHGLCCSSGLVIRSCIDLLHARYLLKQRGVDVQLTGQFVEIFEEQVTDLISGQNAMVRRDTGEISGATQVSLDSIEQIVDTLQQGHRRKRFAGILLK